MYLNVVDELLQQCLRLVTVGFELRAGFFHDKHAFPLVELVLLGFCFFQSHALGFCFTRGFERCVFVPLLLQCLLPVTSTDNNDNNNDNNW